MELDQQESQYDTLMQSYDVEDINRFKEVSELELCNSMQDMLRIENQNFEQSKSQWLNLNEIYKITYTIADLPDLLSAMCSGSEKKYLMAAQGFRKILSLDYYPLIQKVIDSGVLPFLIDWVQKFDYPQLQLESARTISNIAYGTHQHCQFIVDRGCVPLLIQLMNSPNEEVKEQAVMALGNIGGDSAYCRDVVLQNQGLPLLINCLKNSQKFTMIQKASWAISNLCRLKPLPNFRMVIEAMPVLAELIKTQQDAEILSDSLWALSNLSKGSEEMIEYLIHTGVVPRVIQLLNHSLSDIQLPAVRVVGNIVAGNEQQTQLVLDLGGFEALSTLVGSSKNSTKKAVVCSISNIFEGSQNHFDRLITAGVMPMLVDCAYSSDKYIKKKTVWALRNAAFNGSPDQVTEFVQSGIIKALCSLFQEKDVKIISVAMEGLNRILKCGKEHFSENKDISEFASIVEQCDGLVKLKELQNHSYYFIALKARSMIVTYFKIEPY